MPDNLLHVGERPPKAQAPPDAKKPRLTVKAESTAQRSDGSVHEAQARTALQRRDPSPESPVSPVYIANGHGMPNQSEYAKNRPRRQVSHPKDAKAETFSCRIPFIPVCSTISILLKQVL